MQKITYQEGAFIGEWGHGNAQNIQFIVTENCNLRCKYCYITHGNTGKTLDFPTAKKFIDYFFENTTDTAPYAILDFIGSETLLEVELIDQITDYFKWKAFELNSPWCWNYRISICTNGVNYGTEKVQNFIRKNEGKLSLTITVDGTKEKHDLQRVFPDGSGSYDAIMKNVPLWLTQFAGDTKVTFAHADLPLLKESIEHLWNIGIRDVNANVVFEDVWEDGDDKIFEDQLVRLADYIVDNKLFYDYYCSFFNESMGQPYSDSQLNNTSCGAGRMIAVGPGGRLYPCMRYKDYSLNNRNEVTIGNVDDGVDFDRVRAFRCSMFKMQSDSECLACEVATGCNFCQGFNYDVADTDTNFQRAKYICKMHKARVRANNYFWARLQNDHGIARQAYQGAHKKMYFVLSDNHVDICDYSNTNDKQCSMSTDVVMKGLDYCQENFFAPIFLHSKSSVEIAYFEQFKTQVITHLVPAELYEQVENQKGYILVFDKSSYDKAETYQGPAILNIAWDDIGRLAPIVGKLLAHVSRVNLNIQGVPKETDYAIYEQQLLRIAEIIHAYWEKGQYKEFNRLTDVFLTDKQESCFAGSRAFALSPEGEIYTCPINYACGGAPIGNLENGINNHKNPQLYNLDHAPLCEDCPATHCVRCYQLNKETTGELNVPPYRKCAVSLCERETSLHLKKIIEETGLISLKHLDEYPYSDPLDAWEDKTNIKLGYRVSSCH